MFKTILELKGFPHNYAQHPEGNVYQHTRACWVLVKKEKRVVRIATLMHDIGKIKTYKLTEGKHTYHGHDNEVDFLLNVLKKTKFKPTLTKKDINLIIFVFSNHMRFKKINEMKKNKKIKLLKHRFVSYLKTISNADDLCRIPK